MTQTGLLLPFIGYSLDKKQSSPTEAGGWNRNSHPRKGLKRANLEEKLMHPGFLLTEMLGFEDVGRRALTGAAVCCHGGASCCTAAAFAQNQAEPDNLYKNDFEQKSWWSASGNNAG